VLCDLIPGGISKQIRAAGAARVLDKAEPSGAVQARPPNQTICTQRPAQTAHDSTAPNRRSALCLPMTSRRSCHPP
jgi:hypothetical protein